MAAGEHRLVIVGGGVAGLDVATRVAGRRAGERVLRVTLVDRETAYVWKPMLHTIAAGTANAGAQQTDYAAQAAGHGFSYEIGEAVGIDRDRKEVRLAAITNEGDVIVPERVVRYDTLLLAVGSRANDFGTPGVADHCLRIDTRSEAIAFNDRLRLEALKAAAAGRGLTIGIVGGGATGVELAAELVRVARIAERYGFVEVASALKVVLLEAGPRLLEPFPEKIAEEARGKLEALGVEVRTGARVASVDEAGFHLEGDETVAAGLKVWAAGVKAPPLVDTLDGLERTRSGRLVVDGTLAVPADRSIFAVGDCASPRLPGRDGPVPTTAQAASQHSRYLCRNLPRLIAGETVRPAGYHDFGDLVSLGGFDAFGTLGRYGLFPGGFIRGRVAQLGHALLYRSYQARLHGLWKGSLLWLVDTLARRVRPSVRLTGPESLQPPPETTHAPPAAS